MFVAKELRKKSIAEYLLYMWQIEDTIRAYGCSLTRIRKEYIDQFQYTEEQKEEERISYPFPPSNESNSSTHTLFNFHSCLPEDDCYDDCYDPVDSLEISLFDDACYVCGQDANMNYAYGDELAIVPFVKHEIVAIYTHA